MIFTFNLFLYKLSDIIYANQTNTTRNFMKYTGFAILSLFAAGSFLLTGCTGGPDVRGSDFPASPGAFVYQGRNFGTNRNEEYKQGVRDGCTTSLGTYTKNHAMFKGNDSYHNGWEHGRIHCNPADKTKYHRLIDSEL